MSSEFIAIPSDVRALLDGANFAHLSTLRRDGSPRNHVVWVGLEGETVLIGTTDRSWKVKDVLRDPRVGLSIVDFFNPYRLAVLQGRVAEVRSDADCVFMDPIALKYSGARYPDRGANRVCLVIGVEKALQRTLSATYDPSAKSHKNV
jgi:PPOX class probable F420-dependent enzyme